MASKNERNPGTPLDLGWVMRSRVNRSAVERRTATLPGRRSIKKERQAAWLLRAVTCIDLTTLAGDDTPGRVRRLCAKAKQPVRPDMLAALGAGDQKITVGAVCVYPNRVRDAIEALAGDYTKEKQAVGLIRGLRAVSDFEYEMQMALMNRRLDEDIETVFLKPSEEYSFITSTIVKEAASYGGDVSSLVPGIVVRKLRKKFGSRQHC